jgi:hypothetical protein
VSRYEVSNRFPAFDDLGNEVDINNDEEDVRMSKFQPKEILGYYVLTYSYSYLT